MYMLQILDLDYIRFLKISYSSLVVNLFFVTITTAGSADNIVGANACGECHVSEFEAWKNTHHFKTFSELHRRPKAKEIKEKLGLKRIKSESDCLQCHYTSQNVEEKLRVVSGISCESCHGPAKNWIDVHNDFGGPDITRETETPEHREARLAKVATAGMIRPDEIYKLASNCFQCHTVPNERLVNIGGHKAGSRFELVSWLQGEVRHNYVNSEDKSNREDPPERLRLLYVTGRILDLEYSMRGVAKATKKEKYAVTMAKRTKRAIAQLDKINELKPIPEIGQMISVAKDQKLKLNNHDALSAAADKIASLAAAFLESNKNSSLEALDPLLPPSDNYKGTASP